MIAPCICDGSVKWVHQNCLRRWARMDPNNNAQICSICHTPFQIQILPNLERIPPTRDLVSHVLSNYTLFSMAANYFLFCLITRPPYTLPLILHGIHKATYLTTLALQPTYLALFFSRWDVRQPRLYLQVAWQNSPHTFTTLLFHFIMVLTHLTYEDPLAGIAVSLFMNTYWPAHILILHDMNRVLE